jgi:Uma2 family endonuclease
MRCEATGMSETTRLVTAEELERFPHDDRRYELVEGRVVRMTPVGYAHSRVVARLLSMLERHVREAHLGVAATELGFRLRSNPDTVRAPDIAFIRRERIPSIDPKGFWHGPPDLAAEVRSPAETAPGIRSKAAEYLAAGVRLVLAIDPEQQTVTVYRRATAPTVLRSGERLDLDEVVAGFHCDVTEIFGEKR